MLFRHLFYARIYTLTLPTSRYKQSLPLLVGEGIKGWGKRKNY
jgi:hypothetical protein